MSAIPVMKQVAEGKPDFLVTLGRAAAETTNGGRFLGKLHRNGQCLTPVLN